MSLSEIEFALFLPLLLLVYWARARSRVWQNATLLAGSYAFYISWDWRFLALIVLLTLSDFFWLRQMVDQSDAKRRFALIAILAVNLGVLFAFKYANFFIDSAGAALRALGLTTSVATLHILLPLGISFLTLQRIGLALDVYWRRTAPPGSLLDFANFCCFFPQLAAGPICRGNELLVQFGTARVISSGAVYRASTSILLGFALKAWAADAIGAAWVAPIFGSPASYSWFGNVVGVVGFALQVFGDFAGYSLMAIGVALLFGVQLPENFEFPFLSKSLPELWRRWHITLNRWLFDYVFTPLVTGRGKLRGNTEVALLITFLASGLWHGAAWTFVVWGALHGVGMIIHVRWDEWFRTQCRRDKSFVRLRRSRLYAVAAWTLTMLFFALTMIPFRAPDMNTAGVIVRQLAGGSGMWPDFTGFTGISACLAAAFIVAYHASSMEWLSGLRQWYGSTSPVFRGLAFGAAICVILVFAPVGSGSFIYQQF